jgi:hypothetical protein
MIDPVKLARTLSQVRFAAKLANSETIRGIVRQGLKNPTGNFDEAIAQDHIQTPGSNWRGVLADAIQDHTEDEDFANRIRMGVYGRDWFIPYRGEIPVKGASLRNMRRADRRYIPVLDRIAELVSQDTGRQLSRFNFHPETLRELLLAIPYNFSSYGTTDTARRLANLPTNNPRAEQGPRYLFGLDENDEISYAPVPANA